MLHKEAEDLFQRGIEQSPADCTFKRMELSGYFCTSLLLGGETTGKGHEACGNIGPHLTEVVAVTAEQCRAKQEGRALIHVEVIERPSLRKTLHDCLKNSNVNEGWCWLSSLKESNGFHQLMPVCLDDRLSHCPDQVWLSLMLKEQDD